MDRWGDYWRFTSASTNRLFNCFFEKDKTIINTYGNVLVAASYLYGLTIKDLKKKELDFCDSNYQVLITIKAIK